MNDLPARLIQISEFLPELVNPHLPLNISFLQLIEALFDFLKLLSLFVSFAFHFLNLLLAIHFPCALHSGEICVKDVWDKRSKYLHIRLHERTLLGHVPQAMQTRIGVVHSCREPIDVGVIFLEVFENWGGQFVYPVTETQEIKQRIILLLLNHIILALSIFLAIFILL